MKYNLGRIFKEVKCCFKGIKDCCKEIFIFFVFLYKAIQEKMGLNGSKKIQLNFEND